MRRWAIAAGVATLLIGALLFMRPFATRDRDVISSTPATAGPFMPLVPIDVKPGDRFCISEVPFDRESKLARLFIYTFGKPGAPLQVEAGAERGYSYVGRFPGGYPEGQVEIPLRPPAKSLNAQFCLTNKGKTK